MLQLEIIKQGKSRSYSLQSKETYINVIQSFSCYENKTYNT